MFERFTPEARDVVKRSQDEARQLRHPFIGPEHLLISLAGDTGPGAQVLSSRGITADMLRTRLGAITGDDLDVEALAALGIDLDKVRVASETHLGPGALKRRAPVPSGHLPFSKPSKKVLELAVRESTRRHSGEISLGHLLLGLLREAETGDPEAPVARLLDVPELDLGVLRGETETAHPRNAQPE